MDNAAPVDVLICGAGAAGLTLAIDLARRGVSFRLIDKLPSPFAGSRGKAIQPRTLEIFEDLGFVDRIAAVGGYYPPRLEHQPDGTSQEGESYIIEAPTPDEPYRTALLVPQLRTEEVMRERLAELGHAPEYGRELQAFEQTADHVVARVGGASGVETIHCRYLVGGDGGRSFVRQTLKVDFPGKTLGVRAIVTDIELDGLARDAWHRFNPGDSERQIAFCPLPHSNLFQLQARIPLDGEVEFSRETLQTFIDTRIANSGMTVRRVIWGSAYNMNARLADRYRVGRVFLMGDAAHIHPPTGGQGLNTSVQDAYNLGWKLEAALTGASEALLDSYEGERRPIAADMLGLATGLLDKMKQGDSRRGRETNQLDLGYPPSSLSPDLPKWTGKVQAGDRAPDAPLRGAAGQSQRLFDLFRGPHWTLVVRGDATDALPKAGPRLLIHRIGATGEFHDTEDQLATRYGMTDGDLLLVRPDGYVGVIAAAADRARVADYVTKLGIAA